MDRHLTALEALDRHAAARLLALVAAPGGLALAGAQATADAHARLAGACVVRNLVEPHRSGLSLESMLRTRRRRAPDATPWRSCRAPAGCPRAYGGDASC